jgi:cytochrome c-type biogenesis protein CcmF
MSVEREGESLGPLSTEWRYYRVNQLRVTEVGIRSTLLEDLYLILGDAQDFEGIVANNPGSQQIVAEVQVNPLVGWIWYGGIVLTLGSLIALWPAAETTRRRKASTEESAAQEALAEAASG